MKTQKYHISISKVKNGVILSDFVIEAVNDIGVNTIMEKLIIHIAAQLEFETNGRISLAEINWTCQPINKYIDTLVRDGNVLLKQANL